MLTENHIMESLSRAYVQAIAGRAGLNLKLDQNVFEFDYGVDGTFRPIKSFGNGRLVDAGFPLDFQLKATKNWKLDRRCTHIHYKMKSEAYNKIVERNNEQGAVPQILILLCLPNKSTHWLENSEDQLLIRKCCYWMRLVGTPTNNPQGITVKIPRTQHLTTSSIIQLLDNVRTGVWQ